MAEGGENRTEAPTPRRRTEARERGQVARSAELSSAVVVLTGLVSLSVFAAGISRTLGEFTARMLGGRDAGALAEVDVATAGRASAAALLWSAGPVLAAVALASLAANVLQVGLLVTTHPLEPSLDRLNPLRGLSRLASGRTLVQLALNLVKLLTVGWLIYGLLGSRAGDVMASLGLGGAAQLAWMARTAYDFALRVALLLFVLAILDYVWQRFRFERDLRMTKEEVREEMRRMEGDPLLKQRRRQLQMKLAVQRLRRDVPRADVVVTNPTELAIAIRYDAVTMAAPKVVAKGADYMAQRIREIAAEHHIPIVERKPLAQALFKAVEAGQEIPPTFYKAVAEILAYVYELARRTGRTRRAAVA